MFKMLITVPKNTQFLAGIIIADMSTPGSGDEKR